MSENGAGDGRALLSNFFSCIGYTLSGLMPRILSKEKKRHGFVFYFWVTIIVAIELLANFLCATGFSIVGSGLFQVCSSASIVFTTLLAVLFLGKKPTLKQIAGISAVILGLSLSAFPGKSDVDNSKQQDSAGLAIIYGMLISLGGIFCFSSSATIQDYLLNKRKDLNITGQDLSSSCGSIETLIFLAYIWSYVIPKWDTLISEPMQSKGGNGYIVVLLLISISVSATVSSYLYFYLVSHIGAVSTGLFQALTTIGVFFMSSLLFCGPNAPQQCLTLYKYYSIVLVFLGILLYSFGRPKTNELQPCETNKQKPE